MPGGYWGGLVSGFDDRRRLTDAQNYQRELGEREKANAVFKYLLESRDPQMQELALSGMMEPITKQKGLGGFLGKYQSNPQMAAIVARMNEMVPDDAGGGPPPIPGPSGSAAMSTNQTTTAGAGPINAAPAGQPGAPPVSTATDPLAPPPALAAEGDPSIQPDLMGAGGPPGMPGVDGMMPLPVSKWKRRGTGVPTAEEVAEMNARVPLQARLTVATQQLRAAGATPEEIQQAVMGMLGAPQNQRTLSAVTQWGVKLPGQPNVVPVLLDQNKGYVTAGGQPLPPNAEMVRMSGATGTGGSLTSTAEDSPEMRQQLIAMGADPQQVAAGSPTGYWRIRQAADGSVMVQPGEYTPPPALSGTFTNVDDAGLAVTQGITRGGGLGPVLGTTNIPQPNYDAQAFLATVDKAITAAETPRLPWLPRRVMSQAERNNITAILAKEAGLPYVSYFEVQQAAKSPMRPAPQPTAPRAAPTARPQTVPNEADMLRQRALEIMQGTRAGSGGSGGSGSRGGGPPQNQAAPARAGGPGRR